MNIRTIEESDYNFIITNLNSWWNGRKMTDMLPRLFFKYFKTSSFVFIKNSVIIGFLIGFKSQDNSKLGYIHFVGVSPDSRGRGVGKELYEKFFDYCSKEGIELVQCVTSNNNLDSIKYHHAMGFQAHSYEANGDCSYIVDYDGKDEHRVLFSKKLV